MGYLDIHGMPHPGPADPTKGERTDHDQTLYPKPVEIDWRCGGQPHSLKGESFSPQNEIVADSALLSREPRLPMRMRSGSSPIFFGPYDSTDSLQEAPGFFMFAIQSRSGLWLPFNVAGQSGISMVDLVEREADRFYERYDLDLGEDYSVFARYHCPKLGHICRSENLHRDVALLSSSSYSVDFALQESR